MRFDVLPFDDGWGVWDSGTGGWKHRCTDQVEAEQKAVELNLAYDQYGPRAPQHRRRVHPPVAVDTWAPAGQVTCWVKDRGRWLAAVTDPNGHIRWVDGEDLRRRP